MDKEEIVGIIDTLADKLQVPVEHVYEVYVAQAGVEALTTLIPLSFAIAAGAFSAWMAKKRDKIDKKDGDAWVNMTLAAIVGAAVAGVATIASLVYAANIPTLLFNPEYWAIQQIVGR